ncbi:hypothetical protein SMC26_19190 [Actinomadura fulvescens]|uniref:Uncharacterized protein n=1 Tax=Actinomadura fulvescens TaxID=46160 RepID=A0ABN3QGE7_9ACTN
MPCLGAPLPGGFSSAARLAELLETVADRVEVPGIPLFAGWRDVQRPDDAPARVVQLAHVLREHRGGLHLSAVLTTGITQREATLTRDNGLRRAEFLGWQGPYPRIDGLLRAASALAVARHRSAAPQAADALT